MPLRKLKDSAQLEIKQYSISLALSYMSDSMHHIALTPVLDITGAPALLKMCNQHADNQLPLTIDASNVERITTPAFQILIACITKRRAQNLSTTIASQSDAFKDSAKTLGFAAFFNQEELVHG